MVVAHMVVLTEAAVADFKWQLQNSPAGLLILLLDPIQTSDVALLRKAQEKRHEFIRRLLELDFNRWGVHKFGSDAGAFLYKRNRVEALREVGVKRVGDHIYMSAEFHLAESYNPRTAVAVGVCYRLNHTQSRNAPWPRDFLTVVSEAVRAERVRFLGGVFDCPCEQAAELGRSCGAMPSCPFAQCFKDTHSGVTTIVYNPAFLFVIGGANCIRPVCEDQP